MEYIKCKLEGCENKFGGSGKLPLYCPDHNDMNKNIKKIPLFKMTMFIKCEDCQHICFNDDDSVCLKCGSKNTKRILENSRIFKLRY